MPVSIQRLNNMKKSIMENLQQAMNVLEDAPVDDTESERAFRTAADMATQAAKDAYIASGVIYEQRI